MARAHSGSLAPVEASLEFSSESEEEELKTPPTPSYSCCPIVHFNKCTVCGKHDCLGKSKHVTFSGIVRPFASPNVASVPSLLSELRLDKRDQGKLNHCYLVPDSATPADLPKVRALLFSCFIHPCNIDISDDNFDVKFGSSRDIFKRRSLLDNIDHWLVLSPEDAQTQLL